MSWDISSVTTMEWMFRFASSFNNNILSREVSNVTIMDWIFRLASLFYVNISSWGNMFDSASSLNNVFYLGTYLAWQTCLACLILYRHLIIIYYVVTYPATKQKCMEIYKKYLTDDKSIIVDAQNKTRFKNRMDSIWETPRG